jgi:hypothetical protein
LETPFKYHVVVILIHKVPLHGLDYNYIVIPQLLDKWYRQNLVHLQDPMLIHLSLLLISILHLQGHTFIIAKVLVVLMVVVILSSVKPLDPQ